MGKFENIIEQILRGAADANIQFEDIRAMLLHMGFEERIRGSHHLYRKSGIEEKINLQRAGSKAKPYQVKQVHQVILRHHLSEE